jgi:PAS domain S-box-containing protein
MRNDLRYLLNQDRSLLPMIAGMMVLAFVLSHYLPWLAGTILAALVGVVTLLAMVLQRTLRLLNSERLQAEQALQAEHTRAQDYLDTANVLITSLDRHGRILAINHKGCQLLGKSPSQLIGQEWPEYAHHGTEREMAHTSYERLMKDELPFAEYYESILANTIGQRIPMAWHLTLIRDGQNTPCGLFIVGTNIAEQKRIEREFKGGIRNLEEKVSKNTSDIEVLNRRLTLATRAANMGVWEWDIATNQIFWNEQMSFIYGIPHIAIAPAAERMRAVVPEDLAFIENNYRTIVSSSHEQNPGESGEYRITRPSGEIRHIYSTGTVERDKQGKVTRAVGVNLDITTHRQTEKELREAKEVAEASDHAKSEFLANVTHELRTPLSAILGITEMACERSTDEQQRDQLNKVLLAGNHLHHVINDLLDLSKISARQLHIESISFSPRAMLHRCLDIMSHRAKTKGLSLRITIDDSLPDQVLGDQSRIEQILINLIGNAIKFTASGRVELCALVNPPGVATPSRPPSLSLAIQVKDTGIGIAKTDLDRLFLPFHQADTSISRRFGGSGLGLSISKQLAELMGGDIHVTSFPGIGSTFTLHINLLIDETCAAAATTMTLPQPPTRSATATDSARPLPHYHDTRVLIVDDQPLNREIVENLLHKMGITTHTAENGQEALYMLESSGVHGYDLVLMDIQMPIMDGLAATRELRRWASQDELPIIAMTAHTLAHEKEAALKAGMNDHIGKPFNSAVFFNILSQWLDPAKQLAQKPPVPSAAIMTKNTAAPLSVATAKVPDTVTHQETSPCPALQGKLSHIPGLDSATALSRFGDQEERYIHWLQEFTTSAPATIAQIRALITAEHWKEAADSTHAYKGRTGMLGMHQLHQHATRLESHLRQQQPDQVVLDALAQLTEEMCGHLGSIS